MPKDRISIFNPDSDLTLLVFGVRDWTFAAITGDRTGPGVLYADKGLEVPISTTEEAEGAREYAGLDEKTEGELGKFAWLTTTRDGGGA